MGGLAISSSLGVSLSVEQVTSAFVSISSETSIDYSLSVLSETSVSFFSRSELGFMVISQGVQIEHYAEIAVEIQQSLIASFGSK